MSFSMKDLMTPEPSATSQPQPTALQPQTVPAMQPTGVQATPSSPVSSQMAPGAFSMRDLMGDESTQQTQVGNDPGKPKFAPYNVAAFGRYTTPENYEKWASTQPKIGPDSKPGEYEAWTSANTPGGAKETLKDSLRPLPYAALAGGTALGVAAIPEVLPSVLIHTVEGVKALGAWAEAHPYKAFMLYQVAKELLPGAKNAMGLVKAAPVPE
jgi:hypothetical protein